MASNDLTSYVVRETIMMGFMGGRFAVLLFLARYLCYLLRRVFGEYCGKICGIASYITPFCVAFYHINSESQCGRCFEVEM
jgi:hypothetical protein